MQAAWISDYRAGRQAPDGDAMIARDHRMGGMLRKRIGDLKADIVARIPRNWRDRAHASSWKRSVSPASPAPVSNGSSGG